MEDDDYVALSAVEHHAFCPRQVYLIHAEGQFAGNRFTVEGDLLHRRVVDGEDETRPGVRICRSLHLVNHRLGVRGIADVVEFHGNQPVPIEYKRGGGRGRRCQHLQLVLQALCLEEMLGVVIKQGFLWHGVTRRREAVVIDAGARADAEAEVAATRACLAQKRAPAAVNDDRCESCSLKPLCLPAATAGTPLHEWASARTSH